MGYPDVTGLSLNPYLCLVITDTKGWRRAVLIFIAGETTCIACALSSSVFHPLFTGIFDVQLCLCHEYLPQNNLWKSCCIKYSNYWESQETSNIWFWILLRVFSEKLQFWPGILIWKPSGSYYFMRTFTQSCFEGKKKKMSNRNFILALIIVIIADQGILK